MTDLTEQEVCIGSLGQQKVYLHWSDVKDICTYAVSAAYEQTKRENARLKKWCEEFNALEVAKENAQLKELLKEIIADADLSYCDSDIELRIDEALR